jgi:membrane glycosyltransferase
MRRAGFEVRVLPVEGGSYEDNPPNLLEFTGRDLRWCRGNLQYVQLLAMPGLFPVSRFQMIWAISMFAGLPAWTAIIILIALMPLTQDNLSAFPALSTAAFYVVFLSFHLAPKLAGFLDVFLTPGGLKSYGGPGRFAAGCCIELIASFLIGAITSLRTSLFMLGLIFGRTIGWDRQARDAQALSWRRSAAAFWPQTLFGLILFGIGAARSPHLLLWSLPLTLGYLAAIPFAKATASPELGAWFARIGLCAIPEERASSRIFMDVRQASGHEGG